MSDRASGGSKRVGAGGAGGGWVWLHNSAERAFAELESEAECAEFLRRHGRRRSPLFHPRMVRAQFARRAWPLLWAEFGRAAWRGCVLGLHELIGALRSCEDEALLRHYLSLRDAEGRRLVPLEYVRSCVDRAAVLEALDEDGARASVSAWDLRVALERVRLRDDPEGYRRLQAVFGASFLDLGPGVRDMGPRLSALL